MAYVDESSKTYIGKEFTLAEFREWFAVQNLGGAPYNAIGFHHTWRPTAADWKGLPSLKAVFDYYHYQRGWSVGMGPHIFVYDGTGSYSPGKPLIYVARHPRHDGAGIYGRNRRWLHVEHITNGDAAPFSAAMNAVSAGLMDTLCERRGIPQKLITVGVDNPGEPLGVMFHRDVNPASPPKSCPGKMVTRDAVQRLILDKDTTPVPSPPREPIPVPTEERVMEWMPCRVRKGAVIRQKESLSGSIVYTLPADNNGLVLDGVLKGDVVDGSADWYVVRTSGRIGIVHESGLVAP